MAERIRYEVDPFNRLIIEETSRKTKLSRFRRVLDGSFKVDEDNTLFYHIKVPLPREANIPHQVKLTGKWSLTENHNLRLTLDKAERQTFGNQLTLQGDIADMNKNSLLFAVTTRTKEGARSACVLKLQGSWQADARNRLTFRVKKKQDRHDVLTFNGIWEINKRHRIVYKYEKSRLIRKTKKARTLVFKGHWDIRGKTRIAYIMDKTPDVMSGSLRFVDKNANSVFNFKTSLGIFKDNYIKYEVGIGVSGRPKPKKQTIKLFGKWKIEKNTGLSFEVAYEKKRIYAIVFGADAKLTDKDSISFKFRNEVSKDIGANLKLSHKILKGDGEAFLRLLKSKRESVVTAGAARRW